MQQLTVPISYCAICDPGCIALDVPEASCNHSPDNRRVFALPVIPVDPTARIPKLERRTHPRVADWQDRHDRRIT